MSDPPLEPLPTDAALARYAARMADELRQMMHGRPRLRTLAYLLDMARLEAERQATAGKTRQESGGSTKGE